MKSYRLYAWQIKRLKDGGGSAVLDAAVKRWRSGETGETDVIQNAVTVKNEQNVLQVFSVRRDYGYTSAEMRAILTAHLIGKPLDYSKEIGDLDREIAAMMGAFSGVVAFDHATGKALEV